METFDPEELAHKWKAGTLTPQERAWFERWYADFNDDELLLSDSKYTAADQIRASILNQLNAQIDKPQAARTRVYSLWRKIAAAAAIIIVISITAIYRNALLNLADPIREIQLTCLPGQHRQSLLPDGTHVWLSPGTVLKYPDKFRGKERSVSIRGEAYFEVVHDASHPFIIQSGAVRTVVLGTSFDVDAYPQASSVAVTVVSGKVGVLTRNSKQLQLITAGQRTTYQKSTGLLNKENYPDAGKYVNRRNGIFDFKGVSLQEVSQILETQYGIHISIAPGLTQTTFYGRLQTSLPLDRTLDKLCAVMETRWEKQHGIFKLHR